MVRRPESSDYFGGPAVAVYERRGEVWKRRRNVSGCAFPGCTSTDRLIVVPVGPDVPSVLEPETLDDVLKDGPPRFVDAMSCEAHLPLVKRMLQERHQPRRTAYREGRP